MFDYDDWLYSGAEEQFEKQERWRVEHPLRAWWLQHVRQHRLYLKWSLWRWKRKHPEPFLPDFPEE